jgi:hydrogenase maturation protein HypF
MNGAPTSSSTLQAVRIVLQGRVQGFGVRPAIYRLARQCQIVGTVRNTGAGVVICADGTQDDLGRFQSALLASLPPAAAVEQIEVQPATPSSSDTFQICVEQNATPVEVPIPTDRAICPDCLAEVFDPANRRYRYPWTSCTNCGPRYTIVEAMPYERRQTSMSRFDMCGACREEFENPEDRRFHAQTIACPTCGPQIWCVDSHRQFTGRNSEAIAAAAHALLDGKIVAVRGTGGYQLLVDATNEAAVVRLRERKRRRAKPFAVLVDSLETAESIAVLDDVSRNSLTSPANPIVLLTANGESPIADSVHPQLDSIGLMLPTSALHALLLAETGRPLVCTSGNLEGEPLEYDIETAESRLADVCDMWLHHDLSIVHPVDDSVVRTIGERSVPLRLARGLAPLALSVPLPSTMMALGGYLKTSLAWSTGRQTVLGPHLGDQQTLAARKRYHVCREETLHLYRFQPETLAHDLHPGYDSTQSAQQSELPTVSIQHHQAHIVGTMAELGWLDEEVLGIAWDGTGFGTDETIWGGEFLLCSATGFERIGHLRPFRLPGGEAAIDEPWRVAIALLQECDGFLKESALHHFQQELVADSRIGSQRLQTVQQIARKEQFSPLTTSAGRSFDAVASMLLGHHFSDFDGQPAMLLEDAASRAVNVSAVELFNSEAEALWNDSANQLDWRRLVSKLLQERQAGESPEALALKFHAILARGIVQLCERFPERKVVLSGGVFQNRILTEMIASQIPAERLGRSERIPPNDGGLALGQLIVASRRMEKGIVTRSVSEGNAEEPVDE